MLAQAGRFRQAPSAAAEAARRKTIGAHANLTLPGSVGGGFRWGGQIMHSPEEAYAFSRSHGSHLSEDEFFARYNELAAMRPQGQAQGQAQGQLLGAVAGPSTIQPGGPMQHAASPALPGLGLAAGALEGELPPLGRLPGRRPNRGGSSMAAAVRQALVAAHVIHRLRGMAALEHAAI